MIIEHMSEKTLDIILEIWYNIIVEINKNINKRLINNLQKALFIAVGSTIKNIALPMLATCHSIFLISKKQNDIAYIFCKYTLNL